ncbi:MAG TPA: SRPBCC domain-containing protein [Meiothermus sp.]|nr:SRPBCC domain-containing protein [Meiothermus sp.]
MNDRTVSEHELVIIRAFDAPRELVFRAFAEARHLARWWGPKGLRIEVHTLEFRPGGVFHYSMRSPQGQEMWGKFVYREILEPEKIVYVSSFADAEGGLTRHPMWPEWPLEILNTLTFEEHGGKTILTLRGGPINAAQNEIEFFNEVQSGVRVGFKGTLDQLEEYLATRGGVA